MFGVFIRAALVWLIILVAAIGNGLLREKLLVPWIGVDFALPFSGILLSIAVLLVSLLCIKQLRARQPGEFIVIGIFWLSLTLLFEFSFGLFVVGKSLHEIIQALNPQHGDLFVLVLATTTVAPWLSARVRGLI